MVVNSKQLKIAKRYATALSLLENSSVLYEELTQVDEVLRSSQDLNEFLLNPIITIADKKDVLEKVFSAFSVNVKNFLAVLIEKNRFSCFSTILEVFGSLIDEKNNVKSIDVVSAVELLDDEKSRLIHKLQIKLSCEVKPRYLIDENILGGLIIKIGDKVIDNSLKAKFEGLKKQLI